MIKSKLILAKTREQFSFSICSNEWIRFANIESCFVNLIQTSDHENVDTKRKLFKTKSIYIRENTLVHRSFLASQTKNGVRSIVLFFIFFSFFFPFLLDIISTTMVFMHDVKKQQFADTDNQINTSSYTCKAQCILIGSNQITVARREKKGESTEIPFLIKSKCVSACLKILGVHHDYTTQYILLLFHF